ncbi:Phage XkdN-like protein [compost metagenome]
METDADLYSNRLVIACCLDPNFKDADLQTKFGVLGAEALIDKLLNPGQYAELIQKVQELNGFDNDINDLVDEAKN